VVVMSAAQDASCDVEELGALGFLSKPFEIETILAIVGRVGSAGHHAGAASRTSQVQ
jgi:FixJ family two-component response regulator